MDSQTAPALPLVSTTAYSSPPPPPPPPPLLLHRRSSPPWRARSGSHSELSPRELLAWPPFLSCPSCQKWRRICARRVHHCASSSSFLSSLPFPGVRARLCWIRGLWP